MHSTDKIHADKIQAGNPQLADTGWQLRYWAIFIGQALSLIGSALTQFVLLWWITDTTGNVADLGMAGLMALLPQAILGPLGGAFADRHNRRLIMLCSDLISAACMLLLIMLFLTDAVALWHVYTMMAVRSAMQAFQQPAAAASTAMLVPESFLTRAAGLNQMLFGIMTVGAAPLGALAISIMPMGWALSIDVLTALLGVIPLLIFTIPQLARDSSTRTTLWAEFKEGIHTIWQHVALRQLYLLLTIAVMIVMPLFTLLPLLVKSHFGGGAADVALIESLGGLGMIAGGLLITLCAPKRRSLWVLWGFGLSCLSFALTALPAAHQYSWAILWWVLGATAYALGNGPFMAIIQHQIPNQLQGRVIALLTTMMALAAPIGLAIATPLGNVIGVRYLFVTLGVLGCLTMLLGLFSKSIQTADTAS